MSRAKYDTKIIYDEGTSAEKLEAESVMLTDKYFAYLQLEKFWEPTSWMNRPVTIVRQPREAQRPPSVIKVSTAKIFKFQCTDISVWHVITNFNLFWKYSVDLKF